MPGTCSFRHTEAPFIFKSFIDVLSFIISINNNKKNVPRSARILFGNACFFSCKKALAIYQFLGFALPPLVAINQLSSFSQLCVRRSLDIYPSHRNHQLDISYTMRNLLVTERDWCEYIIVYSLLFLSLFLSLSLLTYITFTFFILFFLFSYFFFARQSFPKS